MPETEDELPDFSQLDLPGDEPAKPEPSAEPTPSEPTPSHDDGTSPTDEDKKAEPQADKDELDVLETEEESAESEKEETEEESKEESNLRFYVEWGAVAAVSVGVIIWSYFSVATSEGFLYWGVLNLYAIAMVLIPFAIWKTRKTSTPYNVMLAGALAAILTAIFCLWLELWAYDLDIKATEVKGPPVQFGPASTTAAAWPIDVRLTSRAGDAEVESGSPRIT